MVEGAILFSVLGWGIAGIFAGRAAKYDSPFSLAAWGPIISLPLLLIPVVFGIDITPTREMLLFTALSAITLFVAWLFYLFALKNEDTSPVVAVSSIYPVFSFLLFIFIGSADIRVAGFLSVALIALGLLLTQISVKSGQGGGGIKKATLLLGLGSAVAWGLWGFLDWQALQHGSAFDVMFFTFLFSALIALGLFVLLRVRQHSCRISKKTALNRFAASLSSSLALLAFFYALSQSSRPEEIIAMTATYPIVTMFLAVSLKEESFYRQRALAIGMVVLGVVVMQVF